MATVADGEPQVRQARWYRGAYSSAPWLDEDGANGETQVGAYVECWKGTAEELCSVARELAMRLLSPDLLHRASERMTVSWADGTHDDVASFASAVSVLTARSFDEVLAVRFTVSSVKATGVLVGRTKLPGLSLKLSGQDVGHLLGVAELVFRRMMIGYVDRMGGRRGIGWMLSSLAPLLLAVLAVSPGNADLWARLGVLLVALGGSLATFVLGYRVLLYSEPFLLVAHVQPRNIRQIRSLVRSWVGRPYVRPALGVLSAIVIGILSNKLADLLPWP